MADYTNGEYLIPLDTLSYLTTIYLLSPTPPTPLQGLQPFYPHYIDIGLDADLGVGCGFYYPTVAGASHIVTF